MIMKTTLIAAALLAAGLAACSPNSAPPPVTAAKPEVPAPEPPKAAPPEGPPVKKYPVTLTDDEWKKKLSSEQYHVLREKGTERPGGALYEEIEKQGKGSYLCSACGQALFKSDAKFHSGSGWPSFWAPAEKGKVDQVRDFSHGMDRVEVVCSGCGGHLGHVFTDGPEPTGLRYCINGVCLKFNEEKPKQ